MKEAEQDPLEESSNHAQRRIQNKERKIRTHEDFLNKEIQKDRLGKHE